MDDNSKLLEQIPGILEVQRLNLTNEMKKTLGQKISKKAHLNQKKIFAYKIMYNVLGKKIAGYIAEPKMGKNLPCIISNRGGSRDFGAIKPEQLFVDNFVIASLAMNGYIVIATQYPGVDGGEGIDHFGDDFDLRCILELYQLLKHYKRADLKKIGMIGHSRGGAMTYMCLSKKIKWIKTAVIGSAPTNEIRAAKWRRGWAEHQKKLYGGSVSEKRKRSAIFWANKLPKKTPLLLMHGTSDWRVNPLDSLEMSIELYKNKIPHRLILFEGADHGLTEFRNEYIRNIIAWFDRFLKREEKLPDLRPHGQ